MVIVGIVFMACDNGSNGGDNSNDLTEDIHNIIPADILEAFNKIGIEINYGRNPPNIEGIFLCSPMVLVRSNFTDGWLPGRQISDEHLTFSKQDNINLTVVCNYDISSTAGSGLGSFITGSGNKFSVFTEISGTSSGYPYKSVEIRSGEITATGIKNYYMSGIITEDAPTTIKRGQGRLYYDKDGFSEKLSSISTSMSIFAPGENGTNPDALLSNIYSK